MRMERVVECVMLRRDSVRVWWVRVQHKCGIVVIMEIAIYKIIPDAYPLNHSMPLKLQILILNSPFCIIAFHSFLYTTSCSYPSIFPLPVLTWISPSYLMSIMDPLCFYLLATCFRGSFLPSVEFIL